MLHTRAAIAATLRKVHSSDHPQDVSPLPLIGTSVSRTWKQQVFAALMALSTPVYQSPVSHPMPGMSANQPQGAISSRKKTKKKRNPTRCHAGHGVPCVSDGVRTLGTSAHHGANPRELAEVGAVMSRDETAETIDALLAPL